MLGLFGGQQQVCGGVDLGVEFPLPGLEALAVQKTERGMFQGRCNGHVLLVESFDQPVLQPRHRNFLPTEAVF